jgi:two-component system alkaline phosphatase synthesis response regulator PhoP
MMNNILLVEDEENLQHALKLNLELENYHVIAVGDGKKAIDTFRERKFDLVVLDIMLPEMDGYMVCENIRLHDQNIPILFLSAKSTPSERIEGLKKGGDDYITKPFELEELLIRIKKLLDKRDKMFSNEKALPNIFHFGNNWVNFDSHQAQGIEGKIDLTKKETLLIKLLIENKNTVVSREHILKVVWDYNVIPNTRTVDNFMLNLRKYFEEDPKNPVFFQSSRGIGYKFNLQEVAVL